MSWESNDSISADLIYQSHYQSHEVRRRNVLGHMLLAGAFMPLAGILGKEAIAQSSTTHSDAVVFKIVTYEVAPEWFKRFLDLSTTNAEASRKESGVLQFEVLISADTPNTVMFIEVYRNAAASQSHTRTPHFLTFMEGVKQSAAKRSAVTAVRYMPRP